MITFLRKLFSTRLGVFLALAFIGLIAVTFALGDVGHLSGTSVGTGERVARVGSETINSGELIRRAQTALQNERGKTPELDMASFARNGGIERTLSALINAVAIDQFAKRQGMAVSKRMVDGEIASVPAFKGPAGQFDANLFRTALARQGLNERQVRDELAASMIERQLVIAATGAARTPLFAAERYAALSLEARQGTAVFVPSVPAAGTPTDAELQDFYKRNQARYTIPERRIVRFGVFGRSTIASGIKISDAEIAQYYKEHPDQFKGLEQRQFSQLILVDQAAANAFAAKVRNGQDFDAAAKAIGLAATRMTIVSPENLADIASEAVSKAGYALAQGQVSAPAKSSLGWHVLRLEGITRTPPVPLEKARGGIEFDLRKQKIETAIADQVARIEDAIADGATFDEIVAQEKLQKVTTPPILPNGADPSDPSFVPPPFMQILLKDAFEAQPDDDPIVETLAANEEFALTDLESIVPAQPRPLAQIRDQVAKDLLIDRAHAAARAAADRIIAAAKGGVPVATAAAAAQARTDGPTSIGGKRIELTAGGQKVPPQIALLFSMAEGSIKRLEAPDKGGWYVIKLDKIIPGDIRSAPQLALSLRQELAPIQGDEYAQQFVAAMRTEVGVTQDDAAVGRVKRGLAGIGR